MTVGPLGNTPQLSGAQNDAAGALRRTRADQNAEKAQALGETDVDQQAGDRDADGRRIWEIDGEPPKDDPSGETGEQDSAPPPKSKDPTGDCGGLLDLIG